MSKAAADTLEKVSNEFEAEVMSDLQAAREETLGRIESVRRETVEAVDKILETSAKQAESVKRQITGAAELETRNAQLKALEKGVTEAFDLASRQASSAAGAPYEKSIVGLIQEGLDAIGAHAKVGCAAKDRRTVAAAIKRLGEKVGVSLEEEPVETIGGVVLTTPDGSVRFDNTFEARLERMKPTLRKEVASVLTGGA